MPSTSPGYQAALRLALAVAPVAGLVSPRIRAGIAARRRAGERLLEWSVSRREPHRPIVWFHASSVGEGLQARSVMLAFRRLRPECQIVYTHFSPSAERLARRIEADVSDYLPWDLSGRMAQVVRALAPELLVFVKLDVWPELSTRAAESGARVALVAGTVSPGSGRLLGPVRRLLQPGYRAMAAAAVIAEEDGRRLERLGVHRERIRILGDPRFDSVLERVRGIAPDDPLLKFGHGAPTLVAGSTWPADEHVVLRAFREVLDERPDARLILVPHEPTSECLARIERDAAAAALPVPVRLSAADGPQPLLLIDRVGVLAALYGGGTMAYVGGGFGRAGLHSVLEPAAWALPVAFGPRWQNSRDAALLLDAGGAVTLPRQALSAVAALRGHWHTWIEDEKTRRAQGTAAHQVVERGVGAAERSAQMLTELLRKPG